ncbi:MULTISPECIES: DsbA family protein [unclassified Ornithinimicrobium]|uniref:DsbA family protein n=1 Tax=unclassified Ornithinimicrobium TaxID=2615080 RepID=UPI0038531794
MPRTTSTAPRRRVTVPVVVAVVAALITGVMLITLGLTRGAPADEGGTAATAGRAEAGSATVQDPSAQEDPLLAVVRRDPQDGLAVGDVDAPVVIVNYSEFQCPFCGKFARDTAPALQEYVDDGTLRIEWRDFPYLGPESMTAALAGRAAAAQGEFWAFHDAMFADQQPPNSGRLTEDHLVGIAETVGLDTEQFVEDLSDGAAREAVEADFAEGQAIGVTGTPAFLVNGRPIIGAQPTEVFLQAVEQAADEAP